MNSYYTGLKQRVFSFVSKFTLACFAFIFLAAANTAMAQAVVSTDQEDYPPGGTVIISGSGFQAGEVVTLQVLHDNDSSDNNSSTSHEPWEINANESGSFVSSWLVPEDEDELNATLLLTADGQSSGLHASTSFTDANWTIGPSYQDLCGGIPTEVTFTITQTTAIAPNGRFRIFFPTPGTIASPSIVSVSGGKNWTITLASGNDVCLNAVTAADALAINQSIVFKFTVTPANTIGNAPLDGVSASFGAGCIQPSTPGQTLATRPLNVLRVAKLSPEFTVCPSNISVNASPGNCNATVTYSPVITGTAPVAINYEFTGATTGSGTGTGSGSVFNKGITTVKITATNSCKTVNCTFTVTVTDNQAPVPPLIATVTGECSAEVLSAPVATDNCAGPVTGTTSDPTSYNVQGTYTIHWSFNDGNGNISTANQTVIVDDITAPVPPSLSTVTGECSAAVLFAPVATDNCVGPVTGTTSDPTSYNTQGTHVIHWTFDDGNGNILTANQSVIIKDDIPPTITCGSDIYLSACTNTATWAVPTADDNCSVTVTQTGGPASGSAFANGTTTTITYSATDAGGNSASCSFNVVRAAALTANCTNSNPQLYFGYYGDQTSNINVTPGGGKAPYTVSITMSRPLNCNVFTLAGDELWVSGVGTTSTLGIACPVSGNGATPVSTAAGVTTSYSVSVTLMADADIIATVTDADGCVTTCTTHVSAEDVRCFAGNSNITKVTICHKTGSIKNPCVTICVDDSAVAAHLAHGDFVGKCTPDCKAPFVNSYSNSGISVSTSPQEKLFKATIANNPNSGSGEFRVTVQSSSKEPVIIVVTNAYGSRVLSTKVPASQVYNFGSHFSSGIYFVEIRQGKEVSRIKVLKAN